MSPILKVYRKEAREFISDKRVRTTAIVMPFLLVSMMIYMMGMLQEAVTKKSSVQVSVIGSDKKNPLVEELRKSGVQVDSVKSEAEGRKLVKDGKLRLVLAIPGDMATRVATGQTTEIRAIFDADSPLSEVALRAVADSVQKLGAGYVEKTLLSKGLPGSAAAPLKVAEDNVASKGSGASEFILQLIPYFIVLWAFYGCMGMAADTVAGEKEKNTLETLLVTPVKRTQIVLGKFLSLSTISLLSALSCLLGLAVMAAIKPAGTRGIFEHGMGVTAPAFLVMIAVLLPTVAFFASLLIAISSFAKNSREAQTYLSTTSLVIITPAVASNFIGFTSFANAKWISFIPVLDTSMTIRSALQGKFDPVAIISTICVGLVLAAISIRVAVVLFNREQVLTRV